MTRNRAAGKYHTVIASRQHVVSTHLCFTAETSWVVSSSHARQANKWVKAMERPHDLRVIKLTDSDYMRTLENAVQVRLCVRQGVDPWLADCESLCGRVWTQRWWFFVRVQTVPFVHLSVATNLVQLD